MLTDSASTRLAQPISNPYQRGVIWDLDGTLIDSSKLHFDAWRELLAPEGVELDWPGFITGFGRRNDDWLPELLGPETALADIRRIGDAKEARYREMVHAGGVEVLPGVFEALRALRADGWQHAVATSAPVENAGVILEVTGLAEFMDGLAGSEDVERGKPAPDVFLLAAERIGVAPERAVVVEDAAAGVLGAHRAGMVAVGVGPHHADLGADRSAESLIELPVETFGELVLAASELA